MLCRRILLHCLLSIFLSINSVLLIINSSNRQEFCFNLLLVIHCHAQNTIPIYEKLLAAKRNCCAWCDKDVICTWINFKKIDYEGKFFNLISINIWVSYTSLRSYIKVKLLFNHNKQENEAVITPSGCANYHPTGGRTRLLYRW